MKFEIAERIGTGLGFVDARRIQTEGGDRIGHTKAQQLVIYVPDECPASDKGNAEADAFFLRESNDLDFEGHATAGQDLHQRNAYHDAENAIERSGARDGVEMRANIETLRIRTR